MVLCNITLNIAQKKTILEILKISASAFLSVMTVIISIVAVNINSRQAEVSNFQLLLDEVSLEPNYSVYISGIGTYINDDIISDTCAVSINNHGLTVLSNSVDSTTLLKVSLRKYDSSTGDIIENRAAYLNIEDYFPYYIIGSSSLEPLSIIRDQNGDISHSVIQADRSMYFCIDEKKLLGYCL
jgi:hypothetical protein